MKPKFLLALAFLSFLVASSAAQALNEYGPRPAYRVRFDVVEDLFNPYTNFQRIFLGFGLSERATQIFFLACESEACIQPVAEVPFVCGKEITDIIANASSGEGKIRFVRSCTFENQIDQPQGQYAWLREGLLFRVALKLPPEKSDKVFITPVQIFRGKPTLSGGEVYTLRLERRSGQLLILPQPASALPWGVF